MSLGKVSKLISQNKAIEDRQEDENTSNADEIMNKVLEDMNISSKKEEQNLQASIIEECRIHLDGNNKDGLFFQNKDRFKTLYESYKASAEGSKKKGWTMREQEKNKANYSSRNIGLLQATMIDCWDRIGAVSGLGYKYGKLDVPTDGRLGIRTLVALHSIANTLGMVDAFDEKNMPTWNLIEVILHECSGNDVTSVEKEEKKKDKKETSTTTISGGAGIEGTATALEDATKSKADTEEKEEVSVKGGLTLNSDQNIFDGPTSLSVTIIRGSKVYKDKIVEFHDAIKSNPQLPFTLASDRKLNRGDTNQKITYLKKHINIFQQKSDGKYKAMVPEAILTLNGEDLQSIEGLQNQTDIKKIDDKSYYKVGVTISLTPGEYEAIKNTNNTSTDVTTNGGSTSQTETAEKNKGSGYEQIANTNPWIKEVFADDSNLSPEEKDGYANSIVNLIKGKPDPGRLFWESLAKVQDNYTFDVKTVTTLLYDPRSWVNLDIRISDGKIHSYGTNDMLADFTISKTEIDKIEMKNILKNNLDEKEKMHDIITNKDINAEKKFTELGTTLPRINKVFNNPGKYNQDIKEQDNIFQKILRLITDQRGPGEQFLRMYKNAGGEKLNLDAINALSDETTWKKYGISLEADAGNIKLQHNAYLAGEMIIETDKDGYITGKTSTEKANNLIKGITLIHKQQPLTLEEKKERDAKVEAFTQRMFAYKKVTMNIEGYMGKFYLNSYKSISNIIPNLTQSFSLQSIHNKKGEMIGHIAEDGTLIPNNASDYEATIDHKKKKITFKKKKKSKD